jgi:glucosylglycerate synthase
LEVGTNPPPAQEKIEQLDSADLVVAILADLDPQGIATICNELQPLAGSARLAVLQNEKSGTPSAPDSESTPKSAFPFLISWPLLRPDPAGAPVMSMFGAYQSVFAASEKLGARACCVVASKLENTPQWISQMAKPMLENEIDLVLPRYARHKFEGLMNSSIISPIARSLYGKRIHNPMGPDLAVSQRLFRRVLGSERNSRMNGTAALASLASAAVCSNLKIYEVHLGARIYPPTDWTNLSSVVAQVLTPVFLDMERNAVFWQRMRGSVPISTIGDPVTASQDTSSLDISRMIELFELGNRDLQEIWRLVLPPGTLFELHKLSRLPAEQFQMPDDLWARIVYDFALAHRLQTISRDHLLKSMTPLYLAWVASYANDLERSKGNGVEQRLERVSVAFESAKSYLLSRWRWPDRFNP